MSTLSPLRTRRIRGPIALLACLAIALTGCANGSGATTNSDKSDSGQTEKSPLEEYLGNSPFGSARSKGGGPGMVVKIGGGDDESEESRAQQRQVEDLIAKCMREQGFTYVPVQPSTGKKSAIDEAYNLPPDKFAEQYGYGITTLGWIKDPNEGQSDDPNQEIRNSLSAQAKKAYDKALNGEMDEVVISSDGDGRVAEGKTTDKDKKGDIGCRGKAIEQVHGRPDKDAIGNQMEKFESLFEDIGALQTRIENDPRLDKARKAWSDCMADKNYKFSKPDEAVESVHEKLGDLFGPPEDSGSSSNDSGPTESKKPDPKEVAKIKPYELAVAKADYACSVKHYDKTYRTVQFELEKAFVKDHKAELERYRDFMAELQSPTPTPSKGSK